MDKNTPLSSFPSEHDHKMDSTGEDITRKKVVVDTTEPSAAVIKNILNYSRSLNIEKSKSVLQSIEYIPN